MRVGNPISRAQFLRGDFRGERGQLRPPWAVPEARFIDRCNGCGDCIRRCPERILRADPERFPIVDFRVGRCTFCGDCLNACTPGALQRDSADRSPWAYRAEITTRCLAMRGVVCRSCGEVCDEGAIRFPLQRGGTAQPTLDPDTCNGCGGCIAVCPVDAIRVSHLSSFGAA